MPVNNYYKNSCGLEKYKHQGPLTKYFDTFADWLKDNGYKLIIRYLRNIAHFNFYLSDQKIIEQPFSVENVNDFTNIHIPNCNCDWWGRTRMFAAQLFFRNRFFRQLSVAESFTGFLPIMKDKPHNSI